MVLARIRRRGRFGLLLAFVFLCIIPQIAEGRGRKEASLSKADELITQRRYNEAILELTAAVRREPNLFNDVQKRLQRIVRLRDEYNQLAAELLDLLISDPTNDERKLAMIRKLEELESAPNRSAREFLVKTKETALFTYNRAVFEKIMAEGRNLIDANKWAEAVKKYTEGFFLYRSEFYEAGYEQAVFSRVDENMAALNKGVQDFPLVIDPLLAALESLENATSFAQDVDFRLDNLGQQLPALQSAYEYFEQLVLSFVQLRNRCAQAGRALESQFMLLQGADPSLTDSSFLPFAFRLALGRKTEMQIEGILGAMDSFFIILLNRSEKALNSLADDLYTKAVVKSTDDMPVLPGQMLNVSRVSQLAMQNIGLWASLGGIESLPALTALGRSIIVGKGPLFLRYQALANVENLEVEYLAIVQGYWPYRQGIEEKLQRYKNVEYLNSSVAWELERESWLQLKGDIAGQRAVLDVASAKVGLAREKRTGYFRHNLIAEEVPAWYAALQNKYEGLRRENLVHEQDIAWLIYKNRADEQEVLSQPFNVALAQARNLIDGSSETKGFRYPDRAFVLLNELVDNINSVVDKGQNMLDELGQEEQFIRQDNRLQTIETDVSARLNRLTAVHQTAVGLRIRAQDSIAQSENAKREADRFYTEARSALTRNNFDTARDRLRRSEERYSFALSLQESSSMREERDRLLLGLSNEITQAENILVIQEVRRLIDSARNQYFSGFFERAEELLVQADLRWKTTNIEDEQEVLYWLGLVRGALSVRSGRSILPSAPLYPEMSQLLSFAQQLFTQGKNFLDMRRRVDALGRFEQAEQLIREVQIVFPLNQEASLLQLRIEQLRDPAVFNENFRLRVNGALAKEKTAPQEAYTELQDLYEINPRYTGLKASLERIEIALGLRLPPPDTRALARSTELTREARRIVDGNVRAQFPIALEQLNEAIRLNPQNEAAIGLKVRIQTDVGGTAAIVLSYEAQQEYRTAVSELQKGNVIVANAIVERLLQNPANRNSPQILELQKRIQSRLQ